MKVLLLTIFISFTLISCRNNSNVKSGFAEVNGTSLYYEVAGRGTPLVFMHGFALDLRHWDNQCKEFSSDYTILRYDFRGFGKSSLPDTSKPYSHVEDLVALLDYHKLDNVILIGHSMGGYPAFEFAYNYPERIKALIFAEGAASIKGFNSAPVSKEVGNMFEKVFQTGGKDGVEKGKEALLEISISQSAVINPISSKKIKQMVMDYSGWHFQNKDSQKNKKQVKFEDLNNVKVPVLLINGELSHDHYHQTMQKMHNHLPNSKLVILENSGHMLSLENPKQFNNELQEFFKENDLN